MSNQNNPTEPQVPLITPDQAAAATAAELQRIPQIHRDAMTTLCTKVMDAFNEAAITASLDQVIRRLSFTRGEEGVFYLDIDAPDIEFDAGFTQELQNITAGIGRRDQGPRHRALVMDIEG